MPKLNKLLATSIIADIRECAWVANEIYSWLGDIEHLSWKFPTKTAKDINAMEVVKEHNGTAGEFYILLLELAYDSNDREYDFAVILTFRQFYCPWVEQTLVTVVNQSAYNLSSFDQSRKNAYVTYQYYCKIHRNLTMHFVLRLMVEFMDKYPFVDDFFKEVTYVKRPRQISLASLLRLVWDRLKTIPESISRHMVRNREDGEARDCFAPRISRSCQAGGDVNYCGSCTLAGEAVLEAIKAIERVFVENKLISVAVKERDECRIDIYARTQWSVMSRLTKGIETDVETALVRMRESNRKAEATRRNHEETVRDLRANLSRQEKRADVLQAKNSGLEDALENAKEELEKARQRAVILEEENENLDETLKDARRQISDLTSGNNILQSQTGALVESKLELEKTVIRLRKEVVDTRDAHLETERRFQALLNESRKEADSVKEETKKEVERLQQEIALLRLTNPTGEDKERVKSTPDDISSKECYKETIVKPEDDPVADMTRQLIANREKIEVLTRQNERLSKTLSRLKEYRLTAQSMSNSSKK